MKFQRDEQKRAANLPKHRVDSRDAAALFEGITTTLPDDRKNYGETRWITVGLLNGIAMVCVHTEAKKYASFRCERQPAMKQRNISKKSETNWDKLRKLPDAEIDVSDCPEISPEQFAKRVVRRGLAEVPRKTQLTLRLDSEVLEWYRARGRGYQTQINALLRAYMEASKSASARRHS